MNRDRLQLEDKTRQGAVLSQGRVIESNGELVLGQFSPQYHTYNLDLAYVGE